MSLLEASPVYKPFNYPWAYEAWLTQQRIHWLPEEVPLADDVKDWHKTLTEAERNLLSQIFRFFTQADVEVNNCYMRHYSRVIQPTEVQRHPSSWWLPRTHTRPQARRQLQGVAFFKPYLIDYICF